MSESDLSILTKQDQVGDGILKYEAYGPNIVHRLLSVLTNWSFMFFNFLFWLRNAKSYNFSPIPLMLCHMLVLSKIMNHFSTFQNNFDRWHDIRVVSAKVGANLCDKHSLFWLRLSENLAKILNIGFVTWDGY